jgi:hypothetical protein
MSFSKISLAFAATLMAPLGGNKQVHAQPWNFTEKLSAYDPVIGEKEYFGSAVEIDGTTLLVAASHDHNEMGTDRGSVYVYTHNSTSWAFQAKLVPSDAFDGGLFGSAMSLSGDTAVISSPGVWGSTSRGKVHVFTRNGDEWSESATFSASDEADGNRFGTSVAYEPSTNTVVVGATKGNGGTNGAAYIFEKNSSSGLWDEKKKLVADVLIGSDDTFGNSIAMEGNTLLVAAVHTNYPCGEWCQDIGAVYYYLRNGATGEWEYVQKLEPPGISGDRERHADRFGSSIDIDGNQAVVGSMYYGSNYRGSLYFFERDSSESNWVQTQLYYPGARIAFGRNVAIDNGVVVTRTHNTASTGYSGSFTGVAYTVVYNETQGEWLPGVQFQPSNSQYGHFGECVAIDGNTIAVGAPVEDGNGKVYLFCQDGECDDGSGSGGAEVPGPWDIVFKDLSVDFSSDNTANPHVTLKYDIGKMAGVAEKGYKTYLYANTDGFCNEAPNNGVVISNVEDDLDTSNYFIPGNGYDQLELGYKMNLTNIQGSNIWDSGTKKVELCQKVNLILSPDGAADMTITSDIRNVTVLFDLNANYNVSNIDLDAATVQANNQNTSLSDYVRAFKCDENGAEETISTALAPNSILHVCIASTSTDVLIDHVDEMKITGKDPVNGGDTELGVIQSPHDPVFSSITSITAEDEQQVQINTRVPANKFDFEGVYDASIDITGKVTVMFTNGRKLTKGMPNRMLQANEDNAAEFGIIVKLEREPELALEGTNAMINSANSIAAQVFTAFVVVGTTAYVLW